MNVNNVAGQSVETEKALVLDKSTWNSITRRSEEGIFKIDKFRLEADRQYKNYLYKESQVMAKKLKKLLEAEKEEHIKNERPKLDELSKCSLINGLIDNIDKPKLGHVACETVVADRKSLTRRKQDEYKTELRQFIENERREQITLNETKREQQKMERIKIDTELKEQLKMEEMMLAKRKAAAKIIELESILISGTTGGEKLMEAKEALDQLRRETYLENV